MMVLDLAIMYEEGLLLGLRRLLQLAMRLIVLAKPQMTSLFIGSVCPLVRGKIF